MKKLIIFFIIINLIFNSKAAESDQAYQNYLQRCAQIEQNVSEHLGLRDLAKIVSEYNCINYEQWKKNGQELIRAADNGNLEKVKELLELEEADVNAKNNDGITALMLAARTGHKKIVELLINANSDVNAKSIKGQTALIWAAFYGHKEIAELLINANADVNAKDKMHWTALMHAASQGHKEIVELLIHAKADVKSKALDNLTALKVAEDHNEIVELLKKAVANK